MPKRRKAPVFEPWETAKNERFIRLFPSMLDSPAFLDLSFRQQMLLIRMKARHVQTIANGQIIANNNGQIHFTAEEQRAFYGYADGKQFRADRKALIEHGFLEITFCGANVRQPNQYRLIDGWKCWKKPGE